MNLRARRVGLAWMLMVLATAALPSPGRDEVKGDEPVMKPQNTMELRDGWQLKSSVLVKEGGAAVSSVGYDAKDWYAISLPCTVLGALVRHKVYPDPRFGINDMQIPDASDEFNEKHGMLKHSYLPDKRNPWKDPYWYRTEFALPEASRGRRVWLTFKGINYRADVWVNDRRVADRNQIVGAFQRYRLDITGQAKPGGKNCLAVLIHGVDHPGVPDTQFEVYGKDRQFRKDNLRDCSLFMSIGYDCMPTVRDRVMGLWQGVTIDWTGPVDIQNPFVVTRLPLPGTTPARLRVSAELVNAAGSGQRGILRGTIEEVGVRFEKPVELAPGETKEVVFEPNECEQLVIDDPRLWWPNGHGEQYLHHLSLRFDIDGQTSDEERTAFGIREITRKLHKLDGAHGLQLHVNGKRIFCRGGYIQPEILYDWDARRMDAEVRYITSANLNLVYFEDVPDPPDEWLDACDRRGLMIGNDFYGCYCFQPDKKYPDDVPLLERGTIDIIKRYRNHPSLVLYMAMNEGETREDVYEMWRNHILQLDGTRLHIPSGSFPDARTNVPEWFKKDLPTGMNDYPPKSYQWQEPATYYKWVRNERNWMFMMESCSASLPPIDSLRRFIPDLGQAQQGTPFPLSKTWAHHGANHYYKPYDQAVRRIHGEPESVADYCLRGHLETADQHRSMFEAVHHRMWDITSGFTQWKLNACWPSVQWQIYDWFLRPMVSYYYIRNACEPLHVQLSPLDSTVSVVNNYAERKEDLEARARIFDFSMKLRWDKAAKVHVAADSYKDVFAIPRIHDLVGVYFVRLDLADADRKVVSRNFYWLSTRTPADMRELGQLPLVNLNASHRVEQRGDQTVVHVKLTNPTYQLAFFTHVAVTDGPYGEEILPVFWDDNYFSLLPQESREVSAALPTSALGKGPVVEVGGWNVLSGFECGGLQVSKREVGINEPFTVTADVRNTFIDGSRIPLYIDGRIVASKLVWARAGAGRKVEFMLKLDKAGAHELRLGKEVSTIVVR
jgi:hypothetical protein